MNVCLRWHPLSWIDHDKQFFVIRSLGKLELPQAFDLSLAVDSRVVTRYNLNKLIGNLDLSING